MGEAGGGEGPGTRPRAFYARNEVSPRARAHARARVRRKEEKDDRRALIAFCDPRSKRRPPRRQGALDTRRGWDVVAEEDPACRFTTERDRL